MRPGRVMLLVFGAMLLAVGLAAFDTAVEHRGFEASDFAVEFLEWAGIVGAAAAAAAVALALRDLRADQDRMRHDLARAVERDAGWRARHEAALDDLASAVRRQFEAWALSPAEADIAGLMLKGASLRDIARLRHTSETTIRQQAQGIYRKSGLSGRSELAAYFLESLFEERRAAGPG